MPEPRLYLDDDLEAGRRLRLGEAHSHKLAAVLRLGLGAAVRVFNPRDGEWRAEVAAKDRNGVGVQLVERLRAPSPAPDLDLLFAPVKRQGTDLIVEKATELGVRRIRPVITRRTIAETVRLDRLGLIAREAAEQTERFDAPEILAAAPLAKALDDWEDGRALIYADEQGDAADAPWGGEAGRAAPVGEALAGLKAAKLALLIGPEGGFTLEERRALRGLAFVTPVSLGPRILRAETAVIAALAVIQAVWGDWRAPDA